MGLKAGDQVAASAAFLVDSEAQLKGVKPWRKNRVTGKQVTGNR